MFNAWKINEMMKWSNRVKVVPGSTTNYTITCCPLQLQNLTKWNCYDRFGDISKHLIVIETNHVATILQFGVSLTDS